MARFLTLGHLLVEDTVLPDGRLLPGRLGGDCLYAAIGARAWSDDVALVTRVGRDFPPELLDQMRAAGYAGGLVPCDHATIRLWVRWGVEATGRFTFREGVGTYDDFTPEPEEIPAALVHGLEAVHVAPVPFEPMEALLRWARPRARVVTVDPHYEHVTGNLDDWRGSCPSWTRFCRAARRPSTCSARGPEPRRRRVRSPGSAHAWSAISSARKGRSAIAPTTGRPLTSSPSAARRSTRPAVATPSRAGSSSDGPDGGPPHRPRVRPVSASFAAEGYGAEHALRVDREEATRRLAEVG